MKYKYLAYKTMVFFFSISLYAECSYHPYTEEGYTQIWNFEHHSIRYHIFITFMISNLGKGNFNNGVTIYLNDKYKNKDYIKTLEFTNTHLNAKPDKIFIKLQNNNQFILDKNILMISANSGEGQEFNINLKLKTSMDSSNVIKSNLDIDIHNIYYQILFFYPEIIEFYFQNKKYTSFGAIGVDCILSKNNPLDIGDHIYFIRNFDQKYKFFSFFLKNDKELVGNIYIKDNNYLFKKLNLFFDNKTFSIQEDNFSIHVHLIRNVGRWNVLNNVSVILKWFLNLIGIEPFIEHFTGKSQIKIFNHNFTIPLSQLTYIQLRN